MADRKAQFMDAAKRDPKWEKWLEQFNDEPVKRMAAGGRAIRTFDDWIRRAESGAVTEPEPLPEPQDPVDTGVLDDLTKMADQAVPRPVEPPRAGDPGTEWEKIKADREAELAAQRAANAAAGNTSIADDIHNAWHSAGRWAVEINKTEGQKERERQEDRLGPAIGQNADGSPIYSDQANAPVGQNVDGTPIYSGPQQSLPASPAPSNAAEEAGNQPATGSGRDSSVTRVRANRPGYAGDAGYPGSLDDITNQLILSAAQETAVGMAKADAMALVRKQELEDRERVMAQRDQRVRDWNTRMDKMEKDIMNHEVDPDHYWGSISTGSKIVASIGIALGSFNKNGNMALDIVNKQIERDVDAQKANLHKKETMYSRNLERMRNEEDAYKQTVADMYHLAASQLALTAAQFGSAEAAVAGQKLVQQYKLESVKRSDDLQNSWAKRYLELATARRQYAEIQVMNAKANGSAGGSNWLKVPVIVRQPDGTEKVDYQFMRTATTASDLKAREVVSSGESFLTLLDKYAELAERNPHGGTPFAEETEAMGRLREQIRFALSTAEKQGVIREGEAERYDRMIPDASSFRVGVSTPYHVRINNLRTDFTNQMARSVAPFMLAQPGGW